MRKSLTKLTSVVGSMTFLSRLLGLLRDMLMFQIFGAGAAYDAFLVAFKIPNFMRRLSAEGAFSQVFVPILCEYQNQGDHQQSQQFVNRIFGTWGAILGVLTLLGMIAAPLLISLFAPGFVKEPMQFSLSTHMLYLTFPYLFFISLTALSACILNSRNRFAIPAFTPVLLNVCIISSALLLAKHLNQPIFALAWGVFFAGIVQFAFQLPFLAREGYFPRPEFALRDPGVKQLLTTMVPALFGVSITQINLFLDTVFASFLPAGSISWLYCADRLMQFPLGVFGIALSTVALPQLAKHYAKKAVARFQETLDNALRFALLIAIPASVGLGSLAGPIIHTLFRRGAFTADDVLMAKPCLIAFSFGLVAFILEKILANAYYAQKNIKTPVRFSTVALIANVIFNLLFIGKLAHVGLALATALSSWLNVSLLFVSLYRRGVIRWSNDWMPYLMRLSLANGAMFGFLHYFTAANSQWAHWHAAYRVGNLSLLIATAAMIYFGSLRLLGVRREQFTVAVD